MPKMEKNASSLLPKFLLLLSLTLPAALYADATGPDPGVAGVPGEVGTCANCHGGGAKSVNTNGGSVKITMPANTYIPGEVQQWIVTVTDATAHRWGFEATARKTSDPTTPAGGFTSTDTNTQVICSDTRFARVQRTTTGSCSAALPLIYVEQTATGARLGTTGSVTFLFDWKAPAESVGHINVYIAANAANGNNLDDSGDHIYTAVLTLSPASSATNTPAIALALFDPPPPRISGPRGTPKTGHRWTPEIRPTR